MRQVQVKLRMGCEELTLLLSGKVIAETEAKVQDLELNKEAEEARKRIEYFKLTGDDSKLV